jgi:hypothetical protein
MSNRTRFIPLPLSKFTGQVPITTPTHDGGMQKHTPLSFVYLIHVTQLQQTQKQKVLLLIVIVFAQAPQSLPHFTANHKTRTQPLSFCRTSHFRMSLTPNKSPAEASCWHGEVTLCSRPASSLRCADPPPQPASTRNISHHDLLSLTPISKSHQLECLLSKAALL